MPSRPIVIATRSIHLVLNDVSIAVGWTALAAVLRLTQLGAPSLWVDELFSVFIARHDWPKIIMLETTGDTNPPLYNLLMNVVLRFGSDEATLRFPSALFGIATIPLFYLIVKGLFRDSRVVNLATALLVLSPFHIAYAQEARMYTMLAFLQLASAMMLRQAWTLGRMRDWIAFGVLQGLAFYTHNLAVLFLAALDLFALFRLSELRLRWRGLAIAHILIALLFAPWIPVLIHQSGRVVEAFWNPGSALLSLLVTPYAFVLAPSLPSPLVPFGLFLTLFLFVVAIYRYAKSVLAHELSAQENEGVEFALVLGIAPPLLLLILSLLKPIYLDRVLISSSFGIFIFLAWSWTKPSTLLSRAALPVGALLLLAALGNYYLNPLALKPAMREAAEALGAQLQPGDVVAHTSDSSAFAFAYYLPQIQQRFLAGDPDYASGSMRGRSGVEAGLKPEALEEIVAGHDRIWLVVALDHNEAYQKRRVEEFDTRFRRVSELQVHQINLLLYENRSSVEQLNTRLSR